MPSRIDTPQYWIDEFRPTDKEIEAVYEHVLDTMRPYPIDDLAAVMVRARVDRVLQPRRARAGAGAAVYRPSDRYEAGQHLVFPALDGAQGEVREVRAGNNPAYGEYEVVAVELDGHVREFAAGIAFEHQLSQANANVDPDVVVSTFSPLVAPRLAARLSDDRDWLSVGGRWILRALLPKVNAGHRNIAEAVVMLSGEPMPTEQIVSEIGLDASVPMETRAMALDLALESDDRFRNVGAHEAPLWTLKAAI